MDGDEAEPIETWVRGLAVACELWCWLGPLALLPVFVRFTAPGRSSLLRGVTGEVLNVQIAALIPGLASGVAAVAGWRGIALGLWACFFVVVLYGYVVGVVGAVRAWSGASWRYPVNLHVVRRG